jgi:hypothetical protein
MSLTANPLRLTPHAWAKLLRLRDLGRTEVGGFGISAADDLLLIEDVRLVRQLCTPVTVRFDDESVADYFDEHVDKGLAPERFGRIWVHTHPGNCPDPSTTDEETFERCFGQADWALMFILARGGRTYARLRFRAGPGGQVLLPVEIDFGQPFAASDWAAWDVEYLQSVTEEVPERRAGKPSRPVEQPGPTNERDDSLLGDPRLETWLDESWFAGLWDDVFPPFTRAETSDERFSEPL